MNPRIPIAIALGFVFAPHWVPPALAQQADAPPELRAAALERTNTSRQEAGLAPLAESDVLDEAAQGHAEDMLERGHYDHVSPEGETPFDRFLDAGGNNWAVSGENIATCTGCPTPPDAGRVGAFHEGWMQSPDHRENILFEGFDSFGFGIAGSGNDLFAVQTFSGPGADAAGHGPALSPEGIADSAVQLISNARVESSVRPLERHVDLDEAAERVLAHLAQDSGRLPENIFEMLPEGSTGWTSVSVRSTAVGGSGASVTEAVLAKIIANWAQAANDGAVLGGADASHLGFAAAAAGDGRLTAVALFGGR